jgi:hypothetical protein
VSAIFPAWARETRDARFAELSRARLREEAAADPCERFAMAEELRVFARALGHDPDAASTTDESPELWRRLRVRLAR